VILWTLPPCPRLFFRVEFKSKTRFSPHWAFSRTDHDRSRDVFRASLGVNAGKRACPCIGHPFLALAPSTRPQSCHSHANQAYLLCKALAPSGQDSAPARSSPLAMGQPAEPGAGVDAALHVSCMTARRKEGEERRARVNARRRR